MFSCRKIALISLGMCREMTRNSNLSISNDSNDNQDEVEYISITYFTLRVPTIFNQIIWMIIQLHIRLLMSPHTVCGTCVIFLHFICTDSYVNQI